MTPPAKLVMQRIEALAQISEEPNRLTRTFCSPAMRRANDLVASWMRKAGMDVREDAIGNIIGHYAAQRSNSPSAKILMLGSHLDTVRDAGKFDGALGVLVALACVQRLRESRKRFPFAVVVVGFADEEGVRYQSAYLGSKVLAGTFDLQKLTQTDADGVTMAEAIQRFGGNPRALADAKLDRNCLLGYVEVHIEQGPVLEQKRMPVAVVTAIAGQTRARVLFTGRAGHAGTTPMKLRQDALCAGAQFILAVEGLARTRAGLVATVGEVMALPGVSNVIPGVARLSLDVRHAEDALRKAACAQLKAKARLIAKQRNTQVRWETVQETAAVKCDPRLSKMLGKAVKRNQTELVSLSSGAGHDAAAMAAVAPVAMLFVRCKGGISHRPDESVKLDDVRIGMAVMNDFIELLAHHYGE